MEMCRFCWSSPDAQCSDSLTTVQYSAVSALLHYNCIVTSCEATEANNSVVQPNEDSAETNEIGETRRKGMGMGLGMGLRWD